MSTPSDPHITESKRELRARLRRERSARTQRDLENAEQEMSQHLLDLLGDLPAGDVAVYIAMPGEPPTQSLREQLTLRGYRPLIPRVHESDLQWAADTEQTEWEINSFGTQEPTNEFIDDQDRALSNCVAIVVPAHAIDANGMRLGQGKGFYDRALEFTRSTEHRPLLIGLTFESEFLTQVPHEPHDIPVDVSVTESAVRWFNTPD